MKEVQKQKQFLITEAAQIASEASIGKTCILDTEIPVIEYKGERVITFKMIDKLHRRPEGTARRNFNINRKRFEEGRDFFQVVRDKFPLANWTNFGFSKFAARGFLMTESGYLNIVQSFRSHVGITRKVLRQCFENFSFSPFFIANSYESEFGKILTDLLKGIASVREQIVISGYRADFLLPEYGIVVEYDEEQHLSLSHSQKDNIRDSTLASLGYVVIHVRKTEPIGEGLNKVLSMIMKKNVNTVRSSERSIGNRKIMSDGDSDNTGYWVIKAYCKTHGFNIPRKEAASRGRRATILSKKMGFEVGKTRDELFGKVNSYHESILKEIFKDLFQKRQS